MILASSALVYGLALIMSPSLWWGSFICFVPLFYLGSRQNLTFKDGFFYSALLWALGGAGILQTLFLLGIGPVWARIIPSIVILIIQGFFGGVWFYLTSTLPYASTDCFSLCTTWRVDTHHRLLLLLGYTFKFKHV